MMHFCLDGTRNGEYFYKISPDVRTNLQNARCSCLQWYEEDLKLEAVDTSIPCPCSIFQLFRDPEFTFSIDDWFDFLNRFYSSSVASGRFRSENTTAWDNDISKFLNILLVFVSCATRMNQNKEAVRTEIKWV